eukprot:Seg3.19 transcript_id=Seg3.19/GoldUCD/mRNA.D3Y31 product="Tumor necrosis factor receptor superfamily member 19" protein_id=Seg3.19/GoldUCD/D3Y31
MVSIAQLAKFALLLFLQLPTYEASAADHEFCGPTYFSKVEGECVPCQQKCSHGQGLTQNCGLYKGEPACKDCLANHYSKLEHVAKNHEGHYICKPCKQCGDRRRKDGKQFNRTCSRFADAVCMDCPPGVKSMNQSYEGFLEQQVINDKHNAILVLLDVMSVRNDNCL